MRQEVCLRKAFSLSTVPNNIKMSTKPFPSTGTRARTIWRRMMAWLPSKRAAENDLSKHYSLPLPPMYTEEAATTITAPAPAESGLYNAISLPPHAHHPFSAEPSSSMVVMAHHQASYTSHVFSISPASSLTLSSSSIMTLDDNDNGTGNDDSTPPALYSNFYLKLPNGQYMVRCRTADRRIIGSFVIEGHMI